MTDATTGWGDAAPPPKLRFVSEKVLEQERKEREARGEAERPYDPNDLSEPSSTPTPTQTGNAHFAFSIALVLLGALCLCWYRTTVAEAARTKGSSRGREAEALCKQFAARDAHNTDTQALSNTNCCHRATTRAGPGRARLFAACGTRGEREGTQRTRGNTTSTGRVQSELERKHRKEQQRGITKEVKQKQQANSVVVKRAPVLTAKETALSRFDLAPDVTIKATSSVVHVEIVGKPPRKKRHTSKKQEEQEHSHEAEQKEQEEEQEEEGGLLGTIYDSD